VGAAYSGEFRKSHQSRFSERAWSNVRLTNEADRAGRLFVIGQSGVLAVSNKRAAIHWRQSEGYVTMVLSASNRVTEIFYEARFSERAWSNVRLTSGNEGAWRLFGTITVNRGGAR